MGGPALLGAFENVLALDSDQRGLARKLLQEHDLVTAVELAASALESEGKADDAAHLRATVGPFTTWPSDRREELRVEGLKALDAGTNISFDHRTSEWLIKHIGDGVLLVQGPRENFCDPPE